ncbi:MAG: YfhO family protein [Candidatus Korobacteraceae bacterium]
MNFTRHRIPRFYWLAASLLLAVGIWSAVSDTLLAKPGGDGQIDYLPSRVFSAETFRAGSLPLWDPHIFSGMSHIAIVQTAPFYPLNILLYVPFPSTVAFNLSELLHVLLLLGFSHAYFRLLTDYDEAAWLGAAAFSFSGFLLLHIEAVGLFNSAAWVPPLFYCVEQWIRTRQWKFCALGGVCLAFQLLAGWPQMVLLSAIYVAIYVLCALPETPRRLQLFGGLLAMGAISAGLGAIEVLPTMEFKQASNLAALTYSHFVSNSIAPQTLVSLLFPYLMGADYPAFHSVPYLGSAQMAVTAAYMGILPLMSGVTAPGFWRRSRVVRAATISALVAALLSFGGFTTLGPLLYRTPVYNFFRDHRVNVIFLAFSVATLASYVVGHLGELTPKLRRLLALTVPLGFVAVAALLLIRMRAILGSVNQRIASFHPMWLYRLHQSMRFSNSDMIIAWLTILVTGLLFWLWMRNPGSRLIARLAIVLVTADLLWFGLTDQPHLSRGHANAAERATYDSVRQAAQGEAFRTMAVVREEVFIRPNLNEIAGIDDIFGYSALVPKDYADLLPLNIFELPHWQELMANNAILSLLNTRFIVASGDEAKTMETMFAPGAPPSLPNNSATEQRGNMVSPDAWVSLAAGQQLDLAHPFQCSEPPCGMQQTSLTLQKNSVYQLRFTVAARTRTSDLNVALAVHNSWQPRQTFTVSNVQLSPHATSYVNIYVTGPEDELSDLRFATNYPADVSVSNVSLLRVGELPVPSPYRLTARHGNIVVIENRNALPRAFFVPKITRVEGYSDARYRLWDPQRPFDPSSEALVEGAAGDEYLASGRVEKLSYSPNRADLEVSCTRRCYLVLSDLYLPGWRATIDGRPAQIYRTDAVVRGIFVPAGSHQVEFRYRPRSVVIGLWSLVLTSIVVVLLISEGKHSGPRGPVGITRGR